jgi:dihydrofolate reductase
VAKLKDEVDGTILVAGSRRLVQELLGSDLVDQVNLMMFPVALGTGARMFGEMNERTTWKLAESRPVGRDGVLVLSYQRA